jgi:hypothetical protein
MMAYIVCAHSASGLNEGDVCAVGSNDRWSGQWLADLDLPLEQA